MALCPFVGGLTWSQNPSLGLAEISGFRSMACCPCFPGYGAEEEFLSAWRLPDGWSRCWFRVWSHGRANRCRQLQEMHLVPALHRPSRWQVVLAFGVVGFWSLWTVACQCGNCSQSSEIKPTYSDYEKYSLHSYFKAIGWIIIGIN